MPSQVRHFFKVGQERAQGKAMVLCLAHQLAEQLPGMAAELLPVVTEHGNGSCMSMVEAFERWDAQGCAGTGEYACPPAALREEAGVRLLRALLVPPSAYPHLGQRGGRCSEHDNLSCLNTGTCCSH